ncbi:MAG: hypothetical protein A2252_12060 [Elusimicrobia bacterium RIFOXYA2_FULL_39_19]|nr:MAG: hypothetical protein A2252_12060 [Elusimicrobia bacterium RIFOXYA2_FULL_39_19]
MNNENQYIGYLKYSGKLVEEGFLDAKKAADALVGFDEAIRYFVIKECPKLGNIPFEIPVKIQKGSWEALVPKSIEQWIFAGIGFATVRYASAAIKKIAENDFKDINLKKVFENSIEAIQWVIKIGTHVKDMKHKRFEKVKFRNDNTEIGISNEKDEMLYVPKEFFDLYTQCPPKLLSKVTKVIEKERKLHIGLIEGNNTVGEVEITVDEKYVFTSDEDDLSEIIFPELKHDQYVELDGDITRGNEVTNTVGFKYQEHILSCRPENGSIVQYKYTLFRKCRICGIVDRMDKIGQITEKKPKIIFSKIIPVDKPENLSLF